MIVNSKFMRAGLMGWPGPCGKCEGCEYGGGCSEYGPVQAIDTKRLQEELAPHGWSVRIIWLDYNDKSIVIVVELVPGDRAIHNTGWMLTGNVLCDSAPDELADILGAAFRRR